MGKGKLCLELLSLHGTESATASMSISTREPMRALKSPQMHNRPESWYFETCSLRLLKNSSEMSLLDEFTPS